MFIPFIIFFISSMLTVAGIPSNKEVLRQGRLHTEDDIGGSDVGRVNTLEPVFVKCCDIGNTWADEKRPCEVLISPPVSGVPANLQTPCLVTAGICCLRSARATMCEAGKLEAMEGKDCLRSVEPGGEYRKDCCDACKIGLMTGSRGEPCHFKTFAFEHPWNDGFSYCCQIAKRAGDGLLPDLIDNEVEKSRCATGNPCEHTCKDTGYTVECSCNPGYKLGADFRSCDDIDECEAKLDLCDIESQQCVNSEGSYFCLNADGSQDHPRLRTQYSSLEAGRTTFKPGHLPQTQLTNLGLCAKGYQYDPAAGSCVDIDECAEGYDFCNKDREVCINSAGAYDCQPKKRTTCPAGYKFNPTIVSCEDINECADGSANCNPATETCVNTVGSYRCVLRQIECSSGYHYDPHVQRCVDINECQQNIHTCSSGQTCINTEGSFKCQTDQTQGHECNGGYRFNPAMGECVDINECQVGTHSCTPSQRCDNTMGSYTCIRITSCGTGYTLNAETGQCEDDNECDLGLHNCEGMWECQNTQGSFRCVRKVCPTGFRLESTGRCAPIICNPGFETDSTGECTDRNECLQANLCKRNELCVNTIGSYKCESKTFCGIGFEVDESGFRCVDIDECSKGTHTCRGGQTCVNRPGGFACQCPVGYAMNSRRECEDINECQRYGQICSENGDCLNTPGSYVCRCKPGFKQTEEGKTCIDDDECKEQSFICHQKCINTWGSYHCSCNQGYSLSADARTCQDIDECSLWRGRGQLCIGICTNEPGSYSCTCPDGYKLGADKRTCHDINECSQENVCRHENEVCLNTRGGYRCNAVVCPAGYVRDHEHKNRCKRESLVCQQGDAECLKTPLTLSYNYITFVSNLRIPTSGHLDLFTMRGPLWTSTTVQFTLELISARAPVGVTAATKANFDVRRTSFNQAVVSLVRSIEGPQDIELELIIKIYSNGLYGGQGVAKIFIFVSQYEF